MITRAISAALLYMLVSCASLPPHAGLYEGRWTLIGKSRTETRWYVDRGSMVRTPEGALCLWIKTVPEQPDDITEEKEGTYGIFREIQERYFGDYGYTESLWEVDCSGPMYRVLYFGVHNRAGEVVVTTITPHAPWSHVLSGGVAEAVYETICPE